MRYTHQNNQKLYITTATNTYRNTYRNTTNLHNTETESKKKMEKKTNCSNITKGKKQKYVYKDMYIKLLSFTMYRHVRTGDANKQIYKRIMLNN